MKTFLRGALLIIGVVLTGYGAWLIFNPQTALYFLVLGLGLSMLLSGLFEIFLFFANGKEQRSYWMLAGGLLSTLLSIWLLSSRNRMTGIALALPFIFSMWLIFSAVIRVVGAVSMKSHGEENWGWSILWSMLGILLGFLFLTHPALSTFAIGVYVASLLIYEGISFIGLFFWLKN